VQHRRLGGRVDLGSDEPQRLGDAAPMRHPQEVRSVEPALGGPRVPNELNALSRVDEYAIQIEQDGATLHRWNGMNLLGGTLSPPASHRPSHPPLTGPKRVCTPPTRRGIRPRSPPPSLSPARRR